MTPPETNSVLAEKQGLDPGPIELLAIGQCCILHGLPQVDPELAADERVSGLFFSPLENAGLAASLRS